MILLEEVNATMAQLKRYWAKIRESGDPKESPAVDALAEILFMGRQVRLHVLLVAQSATARAIGGPEMRENFSTRILVRYTLNAWRMLVPEVSPIPMPTEHPGRVQVVTRGRAQETQVLNLSNAEAREWAMSGVHAGGKTSTTPKKASAPATPPANSLTDARSSSAPAVAALRWARANDPDFPGSVDKRGAELLYRVGDLKKWARNRPRGAAGTTDLV
ncbi:hypothetical protein [Streptomyces hirsutus]|uniref:hypothetical protein n=1 Tax=Streptomyces hirsutus TaxID=35620 RepID=UPI003694FD76